MCRPSSEYLARGRQKWEKAVLLTLSHTEKKKGGFSLMSSSKYSVEGLHIHNSDVNFLCTTVCFVF